MGWFGKMFGLDDNDGRTIRPGAEWGLGSEKQRAASAATFLQAVAARAGVGAPVIVPNRAEGRSELRGDLRGLPLRLVVDDRDGAIRELELVYARGISDIDLAYDPARETSPAPARAAAGESDNEVLLAPGLFIRGSGADRESADFRKLPAALQARLVSELKRLRIGTFRSRSEEHTVSMLDEASKVGEPVAWLADVLALSIEVALARGVTPRSATGEEAEGPGDAAVAAKLAPRIAAGLPRASVVTREDDECLDVEWTEGAAKLRIIVDHGRDMLHAAARAEGVGGKFELSHYSKVTVDKQRVDGDCYIFFSPSAFVTGPEAAARRAAAIVNALPRPLLDELIATMAELYLDMVELDDQVLKVLVQDLSEVVDDGASAARVARLLGRIAAALPRGELAADAGGRAVRCEACHGLWFPSPAHVACSHCGAKA